jgi:hypothetical protein
MFELEGGPQYFDFDGNPLTFSEWADFCRDQKMKPRASARGGGWTRPEDDPSRVGLTELGEVKVSTVWVGLDLGMGLGKRPVIYETMVFGGHYDQFQDRYCTREEALAGHERVSEMVLRAHRGAADDS